MTFDVPVKYLIHMTVMKASKQLPHITLERELSHCQLIRSHHKQFENILYLGLQYFDLWDCKS